MTFPSPEGNSHRAGSGALVFERGSAKTVLRVARAHSPLRLLTPRNHGHASWVYLSSFGGGFVDGDAISLTVEVGEGAAAFLSTQGPTRVYRSPSGCRNELEASVKEGALLALVPDPISLFAGACFEQRVNVSLEPGASLVAVDVLGAGRVASGERWDFTRLTSSLRIVRERELVAETLLLDPAAGPIPSRMGRFEAFATLVLAGPRVSDAARALEQSVAETPLRRDAEVVAAASAVAPDVLFVRLAATSMQAISEPLREWLAFLPGLLGDDPFARRA